VAIIREGRLVKVDTVEGLRDPGPPPGGAPLRRPGPEAAFSALAGVSDVQVDDHVLRLRVSGPITPVVQAAARYELLDFVSASRAWRRRSSRKYGEQAVEVKAHGR